MCVANGIRIIRTTMAYLATEEQAIATFACIRDAFDYHLRNVHVECARPEVVEEKEWLYTLSTVPHTREESESERAIHR